MKKLMVPIVNRTNYTKLRPILTRLCDVELDIVPSSGIVIPSLGDGLKDVTEDLVIGSVVDCLLKNDTPESISKSIGISIIEHARIMRDSQPGALLVVGDRFDMFATVLTALVENIPILHIQGGERTGCIDDKIRDMISLCSTQHYVSTETAAERVRSITGSDRVFNYGCPAVELISSLPVGEQLDVNRFHKHFKDGIPITPGEKYFLVIVHPNTVEYGDIDMKIVADAVSSFGIKCIVGYPNVDTYNSRITDVIRNHKTDFIKIKHSPVEDFVQLMAHASCMIGNSSAAIREASSFATPVVNIGTRQKNRERNNNTIDCKCSVEEIVRSINDAIVLPLAKDNIYHQAGGIDKICQSIREFL